MKTAEWRDVIGFEGIYQISNEGECRSLDRVVKYSDNRNKSHIGFSLLHKTTTKGYCYYSLRRYGVEKKMYAHRLVAIAFIPNPENKPYVNHKNGIKSDNKIHNLEWCTRSENEIHSYRVLKRKPSWLGKHGAHHNRSLNYKKAS